MPKDHNFRGTSVYSLSDQVYETSDNPPDELKPGETYQVEIELFREGKFKHWLYGDLDFTPDYLNKIVKNHNQAVTPTRVSFDVDHIPSQRGAVAWLSDEPDALFIRPKSIQTPAGEVVRQVLVGKVNLNRQGYALVRDHVYKYFSAEIAPVYRGKEVNVSFEDGKRVEKQFKLDEPVLISGGLTNKPFIPNLAPIMLSEGAAGTQVMSDGRQTIDLDAASGIHYFSFAAEGGEMDGEDRDGNQVEANLFTEENEGESMLLSDLINQLNEIKGDESQLEFLRGQAAKFSEGSDAVVFGALVAAREASVAQKRVADEAVRRQVAAEAQAKQFADRNFELELQVREAREQGYSARCQAFCDGLSAKNFAPAVVNVVREQISNIKTDSREHKFSIVNGDNEERLDLIEILSRVFAAFPEEMRVDTNEYTETGAPTEITPDHAAEPAEEQFAESVPAKIQKYADKYLDGDVSAVEADMFAFITDEGEIDFAKLG